MVDVQRKIAIFGNVTTEILKKIQERYFAELIRNAQCVDSPGPKFSNNSVSKWIFFNILKFVVFHFIDCGNIVGIFEKMKPKITLQVEIYKKMSWQFSEDTQKKVKNSPEGFIQKIGIVEKLTIEILKKFWEIHFDELIRKT